MEEAKLIAAVMDSRDAYERVAPFMDEAKDFSPPGQFWWKQVKEWYATDAQALRVDRAAVASRADAGARGKQHDVVLGFLRDVPSDVSAGNVAAIALELKRHNVGMELAAAIAAGDQKKQGVLAPLFMELRQATTLGDRAKKAAVTYEWAPSIDEIDQFVGDENRVPLAPSRLNTRIGGGALPSTCIILFARPDMGKSTFAVNFAVQAAKTGKRVLYVSNEDNVLKLKQRARARGTGMTVAESTGARRAEAIQLYKERGLDSLLGFLRMSHAGVADLRKPIEEFEPQILIVDQLRNLTGQSEAVQRHDENGQLFRELLGDYGLIGLGIAQAGATAEGQAYLDMTDLDSSKTGLPGAADLMLGLGGDKDMVARGQRILSIQKNKLSSEPNAKEGLLVDMNVAMVSVR